MKSISTHQFIIISIFILLGPKLLSLQPAIFAFANKDAIWGLVIGCLIELPILLLVVFLIKKYQNITFYELLKSKLGKIVFKTLLIIILIFILFKALFLYQETYSLFSQILYEDFPLWIYVACAILVTGYIACKGSRTIARSLEFYYIIAFVGLLISALSAIISIRMENLLPFFENGLMPTLNSVFKTFFFYGNSIILLFFMGKVDIKPKFVWRNLLAYGIYFVYVIGASLIFYEVYGQCVRFSDFTIAELPQYSPFVSDLGRLHWISMVVCTLMLYSLSSIFIWSAICCTKWITDTKNSSVHVCINMFIILVLAIINQFTVSVMLDKIYSYWSIGSIVVLCIYVILSIILLCLKKQTKITGGKNGQNS